MSLVLRENNWTLALFGFFVLAAGGAAVGAWLDGRAEPLTEWGLLLCVPPVLLLFVKVMSQRTTFDDGGIRVASLPLGLFGPSQTELPWNDVVHVGNGRGVKLFGAVGDMLEITGDGGAPRIVISSTMRGFHEAVDRLEAHVPEAFDAAAHQIVEKQKRRLARRSS